jgi:hypothetical protein
VGRVHPEEIHPEGLPARRFCGRKNPAYAGQMSVIPWSQAAEASFICIIKEIDFQKKKLTLFPK